MRAAIAARVYSADPKTSLRFTGYVYKQSPTVNTTKSVMALMGGAGDNSTSSRQGTGGGLFLRTQPV